MYKSATNDYKQILSSLTRGETTAITLPDQARMLNNQFSLCFTSPTTWTPPATSPSDCPTLSSLTCTEEEVLDILGTMRPKVAKGPDGISSTMLRGCAGVVAGPLVALFNKSLATGKVPGGWKLSNVTPISKSPW